MAHIVVCLYCKEKFDTELEPFIKPNRTRYAHKRCADKKEAEKQRIENESKRQAELKLAEQKRAEEEKIANECRQEALEIFNEHKEKFDKLEDPIPDTDDTI